MEAIFWMYVSWFLFASTFLATAVAFYFKNGLDGRMKIIEEAITSISSGVENFNDGRKKIIERVNAVADEQTKIRKRFDKLRIGENDDNVNRKELPKLFNAKGDSIDVDSPEVVALVHAVESYREKNKSRGIDKL